MAIKKGQLNKLLAVPFKKVQLKRAFIEAMNESKETIKNLQINQFQLGKDGEGGDLPQYSPASVEMYGKPDGPWSLKDTGAFYKGVKVTIKSDETDLTSTDNKTEMLRKKVRANRTGSGGEIFGLTHQNKKILGDLLMGDFGPGILAEKVKRNIGK